MDCTNKIDDLRIVRGNTFGLRITVNACRMDGTPITDFSLADAEATLNVLHTGTKTEQAFVVDGNDAIINFDATLGLGWYGLEMSGTYDGEEWRWCMERVWQIVETNERANVPSWAFLTGDTYMISGSVVINATGVVQANWAETDPTAPSFILNKPDLSIYATHTEVAAKYTKPATGIPYNDLNAALKEKITRADDAEVIGFRYAQGTITFYKALSDGTFGSTTYDATDIIVAHHHNVVLYDITNNLFYFPLSFSASDVIRRYKYFRLDSSMTFGFIELIRTGSTPITSAYVAANVPLYSKAQVDTLLAGKQPTIADLDAIRAGAAEGATAYQKPANGIPSTDMAQGVQDALQAAEDAAPQATTYTKSETDSLLAQKQDTLTFDNTPTAGSTNPVTSEGIKQYVDDHGGGGGGTIDDHIDPESTNPVQNKVIAEALDTKANIDGYYETMGVGVATSLKGNAVTDAAFTYRTTGGSQDIGTGTADVVKVGGNSVVWNQLSNDAYWTRPTYTWTVNGVTLQTISDKTLIMRGVATSTGHVTTNRLRFSAISNHVYATKVIANKRLGTNDFWFSSTSGVIILGMDWEVTKLTTSSTDPYWAPRVIEGVNYDDVEIRVIILDLTLMFGAGNEPSTAAEFETWLAANIGREKSYAYNAGEVLSVKSTGLQTNGFNQYNPESPTIAAFPQQYEITGTYTHVWQSDDENVTTTAYTYGNAVTIGTYYTSGGNHYKGSVIVAAYSSSATYAVGAYCTQSDTIYKCTTAVSTAETFDPTKWTAVADIAAMVTEGILIALDLTISSAKFTPSMAYVHVDGGNESTCVHLVWTGIKDGQSDTYWQETASLPITTLTGKLNGEGTSVVVFPDGMRSAGTAKDEIVQDGGVTKAIKRIGAVDLGTLMWAAANTAQGGTIYRMIASLNGAVIPQGGEISNVLCRKYNADSPSNVYLATKDKIAAFLTSSAGLQILDKAYSDASVFKTAMSGVMLYYELATPEVYILDDFALPLRYRVDDFGTERILPDNGQSPATIAPTLGIQYALNASDAIKNLPINYVGVNEAQSFTTTQKAQARTNIGAMATSDLPAYFAALPTSDPHVSGRLWNNNGVLTISAG